MGGALLHVNNPQMDGSRLEKETNTKDDGNR
jgi:hypothetical protein